MPFYRYVVAHEDAGYIDVVDTLTKVEDLIALFLEGEDEPHHVKEGIRVFDIAYKRDNSPAHWTWNRKKGLWQSFRCNT